MQFLLQIMKEIVLGIWLGMQGLIDWRYKVIPVCLSVLGGVIGMLFCLIERRSIADTILSCVPGILALCLSKATKEVMGYGDGITLLAMGLYVSLEELISIAMFAFGIAGFVALILLIIFQKNGSYRIPFLPFLTIAYYVILWISKGGT